MRRRNDDRKAIHSYLTAEAHDGLYAFARFNGPSVSAILQAWINDLLAEVEEAGTQEVRKELVQAARQIDADRRQRV